VRVGAILVVLIGGAGLAVSVGFAGSRGLATCRLAAFDVRLGPHVSEATGQHTDALRLVNRSGSSCTLDGYPSVRLSDGAGSVPFVIRDGGDQMITSHRPTLFVVRLGRTAWVLLNHYRCDRGGLRGATTVRIGVAGDKRAGTVSLRISDQFRVLSYCGPGDPGSTVAVSPFEPTFRAGFSG
jgi:hypothetical protein